MPDSKQKTSLENRASTAAHNCHTTVVILFEHDGNHIHTQDTQRMHLPNAAYVS